MGSRCTAAGQPIRKLLAGSAREYQVRYTIDKSTHTVKVLNIPANPWRTLKSRAGLGLAITAANHPDGGAMLTLNLPASAIPTPRPITTLSWTVITYGGALSAILTVQPEQHDPACAITQDYECQPRSSSPRRCTRMRLVEPTVPGGYPAKITTRSPGW